MLRISWERLTSRDSAVKEAYKLHRIGGFCLASYRMPGIRLRRMSLSLLEQLPDIVKRGRRQAEQILESLEKKHRGGLQAREVVVPPKDAAARDWLRDESRARATLAGEMSVVNSAQAQQEFPGAAG